MTEKPESDDFEDDEADDLLDESEDVDRVIRDLEVPKRGRGQKLADPAWRRLERLREEKETAERLSDFEDYDIGDGVRPSRNKLHGII
ncbi:MAG: hypothetical protein NZM12_03050 [Steroidobacteraceae bacterium]|nr:hypothetical protein [Steroidobacteraceae bacterium]MDW8258188.1 hypothetical protein [Gammaproteobacteria bacterium]